MRQLIVVGLVVLGLTPLAFGQSNLYKMRNGNVVTLMGNRLIQSTDRMCDEFASLQADFRAMTEQRTSPTDFNPVMTQFGVIDVLTNEPSEASAEAMYTELNAFMTAASPSLLQWCARIRQ